MENNWFQIFGFRGFCVNLRWVFKIFLFHLTDTRNMEDFPNPFSEIVLRYQSYYFSPFTLFLITTFSRKGHLLTEKPLVCKFQIKDHFRNLFSKLNNIFTFSYYKLRHKETPFFQNYTTGIQNCFSADIQRILLPIFPVYCLDL